MPEQECLSWFLNLAMSQIHRKSVAAVDPIQCLCIHRHRHNRCSLPQFVAVLIRRWHVSCSSWLGRSSRTVEPVRIQVVLVRTVCNPSETASLWHCITVAKRCRRMHMWIMWIVCICPRDSSGLDHSHAPFHTIYWGTMTAIPVQYADAQTIRLLSLRRCGAYKRARTIEVFYVPGNMRQ